MVTAVDVYDSSFGIMKENIQIPEWEDNTRFMAALKEIISIAFESGLFITEISVLTAPERAER